MSSSFQQKKYWFLFSHIWSTPMSSSLSYSWNWGSMLGMVFISQLFTGLMLVMLYTCDSSLAFLSVEYIMREVNSGWIIRVVHLNGASLLLGGLYLHIGRGIVVGSWRLWKVWSVGMVLFILVMGEAFMGYVLPWGQMSLWGACVITSLVSVVPVVGGPLVSWVWGGLVVNSATLGCLLMLHYFLPLVIIVCVILHVLFLHEVGSLNSCGSSDSELKVKLGPLLMVKDCMNVCLWGILISLVCLFPFVLGDCENFKEANLMSSPVHIQPEWYLLLLYAILRAVPSKLGGVVALMMGLVCVWGLCCLPYNYQSNWGGLFSLFLSSLLSLVIILTYLGASPVEAPLVVMSQLVTGGYFSSLVVLFSTWMLVW